jgi:hypothetical protein
MLEVRIPVPVAPRIPHFFLERAAGAMALSRLRRDGVAE